MMQRKRSFLLHLRVSNNQPKGFFMIGYVLALSLQSCLCCGPTVSDRTASPTREIPPNVSASPALARETLSAALHLIAQQKSDDAMELMGDEHEASERWRKIEVEMATGSSIREAINAVYGDRWFTSPFKREIHAELVAHDGKYRSQIQKLLRSPVQSVSPFGEDSLVEQIFRAELLDLLPATLRAAPGTPGTFRIHHRLEIADGDPLLLGKQDSKMKSFQLVQTLELWSADDQLQFRTTFSTQILGISQRHAMSNERNLHRAFSTSVGHLLSQFLAETELGHFHLEGETAPSRRPGM